MKKYTHKIINIGLKDGFRGDLPDLKGRLVRPIDAKHIGYGWYRGRIEFKKTFHDLKSLCFYKVHLKRIS